jgi:hypothetical protein
MSNKYFQWNKKWEMEIVAYIVVRKTCSGKIAGNVEGKAYYTCVI